MLRLCNTSLWLVDTLLHQMTLPVPPNPVKAKKAAAARAAKEAKMKAPVGIPVDEDETPVQRKKKSNRKQAQRADEDGEEEGDKGKKPNPTKWYMGQYGNNDGESPCNDVYTYGVHMVRTWYMSCKSLEITSCMNQG